MRRFHFRAHTVLTLRQREEEAARTALTRARALVERAHARVAGARNAVSDAAGAFDAAAEAGSPNSLLEWHRSWIARLRADVQQALLAAAAADQASGAAAVLLSRAMQKRRVLERLRDRAWRRYLVARDRAEAVEMDHLATVRFAYQALNAGDNDDDHAPDRGPALGEHPGAR